MKKKRSSRPRILNVYILINIALFICSNKKAFIIITEIWNLIWRCMKSIKILVITLTIIAFATSKSSFAFAKRIYMMLTSSNKHLQAAKRAEQAKNIYIWFLNANAKKKKKLRMKFIYIIISTIIINTRLLLTRFIMNHWSEWQIHHIYENYNFSTIATQGSSQTDDNHVIKKTTFKFSEARWKSFEKNSRMMRSQRNSATQRFLRNIVNRELENWINEDKQNRFRFDLKSRSAQMFIAFIYYNEACKTVAIRIFNLWRSHQLWLISFLFFRGSSFTLKARIWQVVAHSRKHCLNI